MAEPHPLAAVPPASGEASPPAETTDGLFSRRRLHDAMRRYVQRYGSTGTANPRAALRLAARIAAITIVLMQFGAFIRRRSAPTRAALIILLASASAQLLSTQATLTASEATAPAANDAQIQAIAALRDIFQSYGTTRPRVDSHPSPPAPTPPRVRPTALPTASATTDPMANPWIVVPARTRPAANAPIATRTRARQAASHNAFAALADAEPMAALAETTAVHNFSKTRIVTRFFSLHIILVQGYVGIRRNKPTPWRPPPTRLPYQGECIELQQQYTRDLSVTRQAPSAFRRTKTE
jgi:hypothetical protein